MSLFDYYQPPDDLRCPACGRALPSEWQGHDGPCALLVWRQGSRAPIEQRVDDDEARWSDMERATLRLPPAFRIRTHCCGGRFAVEADCVAVQGTWIETSVVTAETTRQQKNERRADFKARLRWLGGRSDMAAN
jgi:hypothetical protein